MQTEDFASLLDSRFDALGSLLVDNPAKPRKSSAVMGHNLHNPFLGGGHSRALDHRPLFPEKNQENIEVVLYPHHVECCWLSTWQAKVLHLRLALRWLVGSFLALSRLDISPSPQDRDKSCHEASSHKLELKLIRSTDSVKRQHAEMRLG